MAGSRAAIRYAKSLLSLAIEQNVLEDVLKDMKLVANACDSNYDLRLLLKSPVVNTDKKQIILSKIFDKNVGKMVTTFIHLITAKKRETILPEIAKSFDLQYKNYKNITSAKVTTAIPLDEDLKSKIMEIVKKASTGDVEIKEEVNKDLIGGLIVKIGDQQIDSSIHSKLQKLNREFSKNPYVKEL